MVRGRLWARSSAAALFVFAAGCQTYQQELGRAGEHFLHDENEATLATLRALESDWSDFGPRDQARYAYLRGVTDYRVGFQADARHWMAIALQVDHAHPGALLPTERQLVTAKLDELNDVVWSGDVLPIERDPSLGPNADADDEPDPVGPPGPSAPAASAPPQAAPP